MNVHDWRRVPAGTYHHFHQRWIQDLCDLLNSNGMPEGYFALSEQRSGPREPDVVAVEMPEPFGPSFAGPAAVLAPPKTRFQSETDTANYARRADPVAVRRPDGELVAIIELVSPGDKSSQHAIVSFADNVVDFLTAGVHVVIADLFPPGKRDPQGLHPVVWSRFEETDFELPPGEPLTYAGYAAEGSGVRAFVEPGAIGRPPADVPLFLTCDYYIPCPLAASYAQAWDKFPAPLKPALTG